MILWRKPTESFFRLSLGKEVRLKNAYIIQGERLVKTKKATFSKFIRTYDADSKAAAARKLRKVKGTLHWVSVKGSTFSGSADVRSLVHRTISRHSQRERFYGIHQSQFLGGNTWVRRTQS